MPSNEPLPGRYRHYKGGEYEVIGVARHSETDELLVVYRPLYRRAPDSPEEGAHQAETGLWVRPVAMFLETVTHNGATVPRFEYLGPAPS